MKKLLVFFFVIIGVFCQASDYKFAMGAAIEKLNSTQDPVALVEIANTFDRIAQKETNEWLPLYYAAYAHISATFFKQQMNAEELSKVLDNAQQKIDAAMKITNTESELYVLQAFVYQLRITSDMAQGYKFSQLINECLGKAAKLNPSNPRVYYLQGTTLFYTPVEFGGGALAAKPLLEKAAKLFSETDLSNKLMPCWGVAHNAMVLKQCQ